MRYLVLENHGYEGKASYEFDTRTEADKYLTDVMDKGRLDISDLELFEVTQEFDVRVAVDCYRERVVELREKALAKLTNEEKAILGLNKA